jgi:acyl-coenzyme A synthetase/AMP-(fatty) acid ligase
VVAPGLSAAALIKNLRGRIDPVFLPRPLLMVDRLPRNATGKLPQQALQSLADQHNARGAAAAPKSSMRRKP